MLKNYFIVIQKIRDSLIDETKIRLLDNYVDVIEKLRVSLIDEAKIRKEYTRRFVMYLLNEEVTKGITNEEAYDHTNKYFIKHNIGNEMGVVEAKKKHHKTTASRD